MTFGGYNILMRIVTIILVLGVGCVGVVCCLHIREASARCECTRTQINAIQNAVELYARNHNGTYLMDLSVFLPGKDDLNCFGDGKTPRDMWGTEFAYTSDGKTFSIRSAGPDMKLGTRDDITD
jgi:general secretion pathway protein G